jgi:hypothetical protein
VSWWWCSLLMYEAPSCSSSWATSPPSIVQWVPLCMYNRVWADPASVSQWARDPNRILGVATGGYHSIWVNLGLYVTVVQSAVSGRLPSASGQTCNKTNRQTPDSDDRRWRPQDLQLHCQACRSSRVIQVACRRQVTK